MDSSDLCDQIDDLLPQTQCGQCGYGGCRPYAEAIATGQAEINRCPPGGRATISALARLLARPALPLDPCCGREQPRQIALIDETECIGCTRCIQACPVDAIVGASKLMHTVIVTECTGCELCLPPCPVDCIELRRADQVPGAAATWGLAQARHARARFRARQQRLASRKRQRAQRRQLAAQNNEAPQGDPRKAVIAAAVARARAKRNSALGHGHNDR